MLSFSQTTIAALIVGAVLSFIIPIAAVVVFKLKKRSTNLPSALVGAGVFIIFALILERILHSVMIPLVQGNAFAYTLYAALAAGIFEETGRLAAYKAVMKNNYSLNNAVMMGLGHGGCEMIAVLGMTLISLAGTALMVNADGFETTIRTLTESNPAAADSIREQIQSLTAYNFGTMALSVYERLIAMTFHVCMSVIVYHAVTQPGKIKLYVLAVVLHALLDISAGLYQFGVINLAVCYIMMTLYVAAVVYFTIRMTKKFNEYDGL